MHFQTMALLLLLSPALFAQRSPVRMGQPAAPKTYALVVGISQYKNEPAIALDFAEKDASDFCQYLLKNVPGIAPENIKKYIGPEATIGTMSAELFAWMQQTVSAMTGDDRLFIYWSGHGVTGDRDLLLLCHDVKRTDRANVPLGFGLIPLQFLKTIISGLSSDETKRIIMIIDACRSSDKGEHESVPLIARQRVEDTEGKSNCLLLATSNGTPAYETDLLGNGVFTHFLLMGLEGAAAVGNSDTIRFVDLENYLERTVNVYVSKVLKKNRIQKPFIGIDESMRDRVAAIVKPADRERSRARHDSIEAIVNRYIADPSLQGSFKMKTVGNEDAGFIDATPNRLPVAYATPDSSAQYLYDRMIKNIAGKRFLQPTGYSAADDYFELKRKDAGGALTKDAGIKLAAALIGSVKDMIEKYLEDKLPNTQRRVFDSAYKELDLARSIMDPGNPFIEMLKPKLHFLQARSLAGSNVSRDWDSALALIDSALAVTPEAAYLHHTKGVLFTNKNRFTSGIRYFDSANLLAPGWNYVLYGLAQNYFSIQEYEKSLNLCDSILKRDSLYSRAYSLKGLNYEKVEQYDTAVYYQQRALQMDSSNMAAYAYLGRTFMKLASVRRTQGLDTVALRYLHLGITRTGSDQCLRLLGDYFMTKGIPYQDSARIYYQRALAVNPFNASTLREYAHLLSVDQTDSLYKKALAQSGYDYKVYAGYASFVFEKKSVREGDSLYRSVLQMNNEDPLVFAEYAHHHEALGNYAMAREILWNGLFVIKGSPTLHNALGQLYLVHRYEPLFKEFASDSAINYYYRQVFTPGASTAQLGMAQAFAAKGNLYQADKIKTDALQQNKYVDKTNSAVAKSLSLADDNLKAERYDDALTLYRSLLTLSKDDPAILLKVAEAFYIEGQTDSAAKYQQLAAKFFSAKSDSMLGQSIANLAALIEFDKENYAKAYDVFSKQRTQTNDGYAYLNEGLSLFKKSKSRYSDWIKNQSPETIKTMVSEYQRRLLESKPVYSSHFMNELKIFAAQLQL